MTNTYLPHVGGVAQSVARLDEQLRKRGHDVLIVAPQFPGAPQRERRVLRVPAIQNFNGSDFSVRLPVPALLSAALDEFDPDIVHSHHPFLLGDTAMRVASRRNLPLVFTHHTMYERYTHYVPGDSPAMQRFAITMVTGYCNLCDSVIAPSESVERTLRDRGVTAPIVSIPTGVDVERFASGDGGEARRRAEIPEDAFVVGHVGRLAPEKNMPFLAEAMARFIANSSVDQASRPSEQTDESPAARFALIVGEGPSRTAIADAFEKHGVGDRLRFTGALSGRALLNAYSAMDVFAFASTSETQGMVLAEAMAAGAPVVALDAPGARELVRDGENGRLIANEDVDEFAEALESVAVGTALRANGAGVSPVARSNAQGRTGREPAPPNARPSREAMIREARRTAESVSLGRCAQRVLDVYESLVQSHAGERRIQDSMWDRALRRLDTEWRLWTSRFTAVAEATEDWRKSHSRRHQPPEEADL